MYRVDGFDLSSGSYLVWVRYCLSGGSLTSSLALSGLRYPCRVGDSRLGKGIGWWGDSRALCEGKGGDAVPDRGESLTVGGRRNRIRCCRGHSIPSVLSCSSRVSVRVSLGKSGCTAIGLRIDSRRVRSISIAASECIVCVVSRHGPFTTHEIIRMLAFKGSRVRGVLADADTKAKLSGGDKTHPLSIRHVCAADVGCDIPAHGITFTGCSMMVELTPLIPCGCNTFQHLSNLELARRRSSPGAIFNCVKSPHPWTWT